MINTEHLTDLSQNFLRDVKFFNSVEYASGLAGLANSLAQFFIDAPGTAAVANYLSDAVDVLVNVVTQNSVSDWLLEVERYDVLSNTLPILTQFQTLLQEGLAEADAASGGIWGEDSDSLGPLADEIDTLAEAVSVQAQTDSVDGATTISLGAFLGSVSGGSGEQRAVLDYSGVAVASSGTAFYFTTDDGEQDRIILADGNVQYFDLWGFERYTLTSTSGNDYIVTAGDGRDFVWLGAGDDYFLTADMLDQVYAGTGIDHLEVDWSGETTGVTLEVGATTGQWRDFETFGGILTDGDDVLLGGAFVGSLSGGGGTDHAVLDYSGVAVASSGTAFYFTTDDGEQDRIILADGNVQYFDLWGFERYTLTSTSGNDYIVTESGNDIIRAGDGNDSVFGGSGNDTLNGNNGDDQLRGDAGDDTLYDGSGNDTLYGGSGNDQLRGDAGDDVLNGGSGIDTAVFSGTVNTTVRLTTTAAQATGHGNDRLIGIENVTTAGGNDRLTGNGAANILNAGAGDDSLYGGSGNDTLYGGSGNDLLRGDAGDDVLNGGTGGDTFEFRTDFGADRIIGFANDVDLIRLDDAIFGGGLTAAQVVSTYGSIVGGACVLDFGGGNAITFDGFGNLSDLTDDFILF